MAREMSSTATVGARKVLGTLIGSADLPGGWLCSLARSHQGSGRPETRRDTIIPSISKLSSQGQV